jgi:class 3 adenylate cyclase
MAHPVEFEFHRSRGIVWVCDVAGSTSRLNSEDGVEDTEVFLPRLYWTAVLAVESAGGKFVKWTGDGFLAWFETALHREIRQGDKAMSPGRLAFDGSGERDAAWFGS